MASFEVDTVLSTVIDGRTKDLRYRQRQFISLHQWIASHVVEIKSALRRDDHLSEIEAQFIVSLTLQELRGYYNALDLRSTLTEEYSVKNGRNNPGGGVPVDLVYILPEKFSFFYSVMCALCACIAAGSCCIIEVRKAVLCFDWLSAYH
jgi:aldehyde dehydrogenase (NAD+)